MFNSQDEQIKKLEENMSWMQKDIINLIRIIEALKTPETHYHFLIDSRTCKDCNTPNSTDLNEYI
jgi:hypothetical protein